MNSAAVHAREAGKVLSGSQQWKAANIKVNLGDKLNVIISDKVYQHFHKSVRARLATDIHPGKLVLELIPDEKNGRKISPFRPGQRRVNWIPERVENCGPTFPKFGMCDPEDVKIGHDGVLRVVLPKHRPPLSNRGPKKKFERPVLPGVKPTPEPEVVQKETVVSETIEPPKTMQFKDTMVSYSATRLEVRVGRELAKFLDGHRYGCSQLSISDDEKTVKAILKVGVGHNTIGTNPTGPKKAFRALNVQNIPKGKVQKVPFFGPTQATEVEVLNDGEEIHLTISAPFAPQGLAAGKPRKRRIKPHEARSSGYEAPIAESAMGRLRRLRDEINACRQEAKDAGDEFILRIKEDGTLGFTYDG